LSSIFHRGNQILTAIEDMAYPLVHFQNANNKRKPLHTSLVDLFNLLQEQADVAGGNVVQDEQHTLSACPPMAFFQAPPKPEYQHTRGIASVRSTLAPLSKRFRATPKRYHARENCYSAVKIYMYKVQGTHSIQRSALASPSCTRRRMMQKQTILRIYASTGTAQFAIHQQLHPSVSAVEGIFLSARFASEGSTTRMHTCYLQVPYPFTGHL
jgi:hypothetical protein